MSLVATIASVPKDLRELTEDAGLHPQAIADEFGLHRSAVGFWFTGRNRPRGYRLRKLADLLGISTDDLRAALDETARRRHADEE